MLLTATLSASRDSHRVLPILIPLIIAAAMGCRSEARVAAGATAVAQWCVDRGGGVDNAFAARRAREANG